MKFKPGVNIYGYVFAESGVGEHTRLLVSSVRQAGIDFSVIPFETTLSRQESAFADFGTGNPDFDINIIGVNADQMDVFVEHFGREALEGRYNIALWAWEVEEFPDWMAESARWVDEIWANSSFAAAAISASVNSRVCPFPLPIRTPEPRPTARFDLRLPESFLFLFCFDFDSVFSRKNPIAVVDAFKKAFTEGPAAHLHIKSINGERHAPELNALRKAIGDRTDISTNDGYLTLEDQDRLMASCDAYVSLHRSEGFGLTLAEAIGLGKPVIATGYSGNLDFMTEENSFVVPYDLVEIGKGNDPYPAHGFWAEPDIDAAARMMQAAVKRPNEVNQKTMRALDDVEKKHSPSVRGEFIVDRLRRIRVGFEND